MHVVSNDPNKEEEKKIVFEKICEEYIFKGRTYQSLCDQFGLSIRSVENIVQSHLEEKPPVLLFPLVQYEPQYLLIDGLWFGKLFCLMLYRIHKSPFLVKATIMKKEYGSLIAKDLEDLKLQGYRFSGFITDGGTGVTKAIKKVHPHSPHQICLAHIHREAVKGVGKKPKDTRLWRLKVVVDHLWLIESPSALRFWKKAVFTWIQANQAYLKEYAHDDVTSRWWFIHKKVRRTVAILLKAPELSFVFLRKNHWLIPKTTNAIEGINGNVSIKWLIHRGLKRERWSNFLLWFVYYRNRKYVSQKKKKRD